MSSPEHPNLPDASDHDENEFYVSSTRSGADPTSSSSWAALFEADRLSRARRRRIAIAVATGLLALAVTVTTFAGVRGTLFGFLTPPTPTPTVSISPGEDLFYLLPNPPGVVVTLDGHTLARMPAPGDPSPLRLARGRHVFVWTSHEFPFMPQRCTVYVPPTLNDTCPLASGQELPTSIAVLPGRVIALHDSLATLEADQRAQLSLAILDALATPSLATVQPSEFFNYYPAGPGLLPRIATLPLRASLSFRVVSPQDYSEPCINDQADACRFPGQDCALLCTVAQLPVAVTGGTPDVWVAAAMVSATTDYTTLDGRAEGTDLGQAFGPQLVVLRITWDGTNSWSVSPIFGHVPGLPVTDDVACNPARVWLEEADWSFMLTDPPPGAEVQFIADANPADGCVAVLDQAPGKDAPAVFLERFGMLLAVNGVAAGSVGGPPRADAAEQRLARQIAAQAGISI